MKSHNWGNIWSGTSPQKQLVFRENCHSLIRGVLIQSCSAGAKNFTNYVFCHPQFSGVIQNIENHCAILTLFVYVNYYQNNQFYIVVKIEFLKFCFIGTMIFGTLAWTIELYMTKYIISEIFSFGGATLYKNPSDQTVNTHYFLSNIIASTILVMSAVYCLSNSF